jgi:protein phosphatase 1 regulatory subunit 7
LDLTSYQLHNLDSVELPSNLTELDLTANRLSTLDPRIAQLSDLKKLSLRQNLITDAGVEPLSSWNALSYLEVYSFSLRFCLDAFEFLKRNVFVDLFDVGAGVT